MIRVNTDIDSNGGHGSNANSLLRKIPGGVIPPVSAGRAGFAVTFYTTTNSQLAEHQKQIASILQSRDRLVEQYNNRLDKLTDELHAFVARVDRLETPLGKKVEGMQRVIDVLNDRVNALASTMNTTSVAETARSEQMQRQIDQLNKRDDQMLQALDAQYNTLNEHLRAHGNTGNVPRR